MNPKRFGENVSKIREFLGMTQAQLAKKAGLAPSFVYQIEKGDREPSLTAIIKIMEALGVTFERLLK